MRRDSTLATLHRLKRRFGRERARLDRWAQDKESSQQYRERRWDEAHQWSAAMAMLDEEIAKTKKGRRR